MPNPALVGDHGGSEHYATVPLWAAAEFGTDYGVPLEAQCLGDCGNNFTLSGTPINGAIIYTLGETYDGSNKSSLATLSRVDLSADGVIIKHMMISNDNNFDNALNISGQDSFAEDCHIEDTSTSTTSYGATQIRGTATNKGLRRVTISATCAQLVRTGFDHPCELTNVTGWGATIRGIVASGSNQNLTDCFFFNCNNNAFDGAFSTEINLASDDATASLTPYTSSELVNFGTGDYRIKSTSFLATAGVGGNQVGAFLEISAPSSYNSFWTTNFSGVI